MDGIVDIETLVLIMMIEIRPSLAALHLCITREDYPELIWRSTYRKRYRITKLPRLQSTMQGGTLDESRTGGGSVVACSSTRAQLFQRAGGTLQTMKLRIAGVRHVLKRRGMRGYPRPPLMVVLDHELSGAVTFAIGRW